MKNMSVVTARDAAKILGISKRTLFRWEDEGRIKSQRSGILETRVYDKNYILQTKEIIELNKKEKEHLAKLPEVRERVKAELFVQDVSAIRAGEPSRYMNIEKANKAFNDEEEWTKEHKEILSKMFTYPRDRLLALGSVSGVGNQNTNSSEENNINNSGVPPRS